MGFKIGNPAPIAHPKNNNMTATVINGEADGRPRPILLPVDIGEANSSEWLHGRAQQTAILNGGGETVNQTPSLFPNT